MYVCAISDIFGTILQSPNSTCSWLVAQTSHSQINYSHMMKALGIWYIKRQVPRFSSIKTQTFNVLQLTQFIHANQLVRCVHQRSTCALPSYIVVPHYFTASLTWVLMVGPALIPVAQSFPGRRSITVDARIPSVNRGKCVPSIDVWNLWLYRRNGDVNTRGS